MENKKYNKKALLAVLAHPDDETFGMGGTLALYAHRGYKVYLVCATQGEVGEVDEIYLKDFASKGDLRKYELCCASNKLGLTGVFFLDYRDSGMEGSLDNKHPKALAAQPVGEVAEKVQEYIKKLKPQVVVTFDPIGGYRHPDHIAIHKATVLAFNNSRNNNLLPEEQPQKLYFHKIPRGFLQVGVFILRLIGKDPRHFGRNNDIDLVSIAEVDYPTNASINFRPVVGIRTDAFACHASQGGLNMSRGINGWWQRLLPRDKFMRAFPEPTDNHIEKDLFENI